jgi:hypothetical protein
MTTTADLIEEEWTRFNYGERIYATPESAVAAADDVTLRPAYFWMQSDGVNPMKRSRDECTWECSTVTCALSRVSAQEYLEKCNKASTATSIKSIRVVVG